MDRVDGPSINNLVEFDRIASPGSDAVIRTHTSPGHENGPQAELAAR